MGAAAQVCVWFPAFALSAKLELGAWRRAWLWKDVTWGPEAVPETERAEPPTSSVGLAWGPPSSRMRGLFWFPVLLVRYLVVLASGPLQFACDCVCKVWPGSL